MDYSAKEDLIEWLFEKIKHFILSSKDNNYKSRFLRSRLLLYFVVLLLVLKIAATLIPTNIPYNVFFADITKLALENFINQTRYSFGLKPLAESQKLNEVARLKAENMVQEEYFSHTSPTGLTPWFWFLEAGYNYKYAGENLAIGFYDSQEVYNAWLNSPSHKANMINPNYTEVGTAVVAGFGPNNAVVVVQEFGTAQKVPLPTAPAPKTQTQPTTETAPGANAQATPAPEVLSQATSQNSFQVPNTNGSSNWFSKLLNFVLYNYTELLQGIIYGVFLVVAGILLTLIFLSFNLKKELVFRAVIILILLCVAMLLNKELIVSLIPHQVII